MHNKLKRSPGLYLTGFMGSGKTTVARILADRLGWNFADVDAEIEAREKQTIHEIFRTRGESEFRRIEKEVIRNLAHSIDLGVPCVVSLGGGAFVQPDNAEFFEQHGISIWLDCSLEIIQARIEQDDRDLRPLARDAEGMRKLYEERRKAYSRAHYAVDANGELERAVEQILSLPIWK